MTWRFLVKIFSKLAKFLFSSFLEKVLLLKISRATPKLFKLIRLNVTIALVFSPPQVKIEKKKQDKRLLSMSNINQDVLGSQNFGDPDGESLDPRIMGMMNGFVTDRNDPLGLGRVVAKVDSLFEEGTDWLFPMNEGGGTNRRGVFNPPITGSNVLIWFPLGRIDSPGFYIPGSGWKDNDNVPGGTDKKGKVQGEETRVVRENGKWIFVESDISGESEFGVYHKDTNQFIRLHEDGTFTIDSTIGKLGNDADQFIVRGNELSSYLGSSLNVGSLLFYIEQMRIAINAIAPGSIPNPPPSVPTNLLSTKWKVK